MKSQNHFISKHILLVFFILCNLLFLHDTHAQELTINRSNGERISLKPGETFAVTVEENGELKSLTTIDQNEILNIIVTFKTPPLSLQKSKSIAKISALNNEHEIFKAELERLTSSLNKTSAVQQTYKINREFYIAINGVVLQCTRRLMNHIKSMPMVKAIHKNLAVKINLDSSVAQIKADKVHDELGFTGKGILVGVIDTGIDYMHPALGGGFGPGFRIVGGYDFYNNDDDPIDDHSHGTHVAGIIGANSDSLQGVAPDVSFIAVKVLGKEGGGYTSDIIAGIEYCLDPDGNPATDDAVDIINMSLGGVATDDNPVDEAVNNATQAGILSVIAAGNSGFESPFYSGFESIGSPGTAITALTVGACDKQFNMADFSSKGPDPINLQIKPEIIAPGVNIKSSVLNNNTARHSGTSMAAPHVAGAAALLMQQHPDWTPDQIKWALVNSTQPLNVLEFNPYQQGNGCVDSWEASQTDVIIEPGVLSFGFVDLVLDEWRDTLSITFQNMSDESKTYSLSRSDNLPGAVQLFFSQATIEIPAHSGRAVTAVIVVPASVPIINEEPFAYKGQVLCTSTNDTVTLPFGFVKANLLTVECDIAPDYIGIWDPNAVDYESVYGQPGKMKYNFRYRAGTFNLFCVFQVIDRYYFVEKQNVVIQGPSHLSIEHTEAAFDCFFGVHYNRKDERLLDENSLEDVKFVNLKLLRIQGELGSNINLSFHSPYVSISQFDTNSVITKFLAYNQDEEITALMYPIKGIKTQEDIIVPTGSANLSYINIQCPKPEDAVSQKQNLTFSMQTFFETLSYERRTLSTIEIKSDVNTKISTNKNKDFDEADYFSGNYLHSIGFDMERVYPDQETPEKYVLGDIAFGQKVGIILFERDLRENDKYIIKSRLANDDTLVFAPGKELLQPTTDKIALALFSPSETLLFMFDKTGAVPFSPGGIMSPSGIARDDAELLADYTIFINGQVGKSTYSLRPLFEIPELLNTALIRGTSPPYSLLGQTGFSTIDYEVDLRSLQDDPYDSLTEKILSTPTVDNLMPLVGDKYVKHVSPSQDGIIRLFAYDYGLDLKDVTIYAVPSSGEEIMLDLNILKEKREYIAHIPNNLPHEFIDVIVRMEDDKGNKTTYTAAPAFFFGESMDEITFDSRVWMSHYQIQNPDDFPFAAGDTLTYILKYVNMGNIEADSIYVKFPETSMFAPVNSDSVSFTITDTASIELKLEMLQPHPVDTFLVYYPELHWRSSGKSYMRRYAMKIKTWGEFVPTSIAGNEVDHELTYQLMDNYPNPFNPATTIRFQIPKTEHVAIVVYDILGRQMTELTNGLYQAGTHQIYWEGKNQQGQPVASGLYIYRIKAGNFVQSKKMLLLK